MDLEDINTSTPRLTSRPSKKSQHFPDAHASMTRSASPMPGSWDDNWSMAPQASDDGKEVGSDPKDEQGNTPGADLGIGEFVTAEDTACCVPAPDDDPSVASPSTKESEKNSPEIAKDKAVASPIGKGAIERGVSEVHFFKDSKNFEIKDTQINAAGRDVYITNSYEAHVILQSIMGDQPKKAVLNRFCSVLWLVLSMREPLPMDSLDVLHNHVQKGHDCYGIATVLQHFGSLLSGISNQSMPICVLHLTFYEFLTSKDRSGIFFVDLVDVNLDLGYACIEVMQEDLCFNICKLESSYVCNSEVTDLRQCINDNIKPYLLYSCHFWADHVTLTSYQEGLGRKISAFLLNEKMLFWFEVLALLNLMNIVPTMLSNVAFWIHGNNHDDAVAAARDGIKFCRMVGGMILKSTPHLYISGLPFIPNSSILTKYLTRNFTRLPKLVTNKAVKWSPLQLLIRGHTDTVNSVAFSSDGKRIASGSFDSAVCIWDAETGMQVGSPLKGRTYYVNSIAFSPDGKMIASGSGDMTVSIWDIETGMQMERGLCQVLMI